MLLCTNPTRMTMFSSLCLVLPLLVALSDACFSSGVCGGGCCGGGGGGGGCMPPPPPVCMGGCMRGYSCGSYGCYQVRAKARSSKTLALEHEKTPEELAKLSPDEKFMSCCQDRALPDGCLSKCSYRTYTRDTLQAMYLKTDACPLQAAADLQFCAAQGRDHSACCRRNGVAGTLAGEKCLTFCDQRPGNITRLDLTYLSCFDRFENMKSCFWFDLTQGEGANLAPVSLPSAHADADGDASVEENRDAAATHVGRRGFAPHARTFRP